MIKAVTKENIDEVLSIKVCQREIDELKALGRDDIKQVLKESLEFSGYAWYLKDAKGVRGVGGVCYDALYPKTMGIVWLLVDEDFFKDYLFTINTLTYELLDFCFDTLGLKCVYNLVSPTINKQSVKWLRYIGFEFDDKPKIGVDGKSLFYTFCMYKEDYKCVSQQPL